MDDTTGQYGKWSGRLLSSSNMPSCGFETNYNRPLYFSKRFNPPVSAPPVLGGPTTAEAPAAAEYELITADARGELQIKGTCYFILKVECPLFPPIEDVHQGVNSSMTTSLSLLTSSDIIAMRFRKIGWGQI